MRDRCELIRSRCALLLSFEHLVRAASTPDDVNHALGMRGPFGTRVAPGRRMSERTERIVLTHLIDTCKDAERGFLVAAEEARTPALKRLFCRLAEQRGEFAADLLPHVLRLGGHARSSGTAVAALHRAWIHLKAHTSGDPDRALVEETARGERVARVAYNAALTQVGPNARRLIESHELGLRVAGRLVDDIVG